MSDFAGWAVMLPFRTVQQNRKARMAQHRPIAFAKISHRSKTQSEIDVPRILQVRLSTSSWTAISVSGAFDDEMRYLSGNPQIRHLGAEPGPPRRPASGQPSGFCTCRDVLDFPRDFWETNGGSVSVQGQHRGDQHPVSHDPYQNGVPSEMRRRAIFAGRGLAASVALGMAHIAMVPLAAQQATSAAEAGPGSQFDLMFWQSIMNTRDPALYEAYLKRFPNGTFDVIARSRLAELTGKPPAPAPAPPVLVAPVAVPPVPAPPVQSAAQAVPAASAAGGRLIDNMEALGQLGLSQLPGPAEIIPVAPPASASVSMLERPELLWVEKLTLPANFCSAEARNLFVQNVYNPLLAKASSNNKTTVAHLQRLRAAYDESFPRRAMFPRSTRCPKRARTITPRPPLPMRQNRP
ncbi:MAG: hypothetical protein IPN84_17090 [Sphingomonadales bacterium]|nr:hypothetical protein [Sphingomonadales bacterium]